MSIQVDIVRVFTDERGRFGNELGLITTSDESRGREQQLALDLGFSETVFVDEASEGVATIRIFTPAKELPFAGHPSVGTAWWLAQAGHDISTLREKAGDVAVRRDEATWITGRPEWAPNFEWHEFSDAELLDALDPDDYSSGEHYLWAWTDEKAGRVRARMFAPEFGIREDEATGAAAVKLTGLLGRELDIRQGRGSVLRTRLEGVFVAVGGHVVFDRTLVI